MQNMWTYREQIWTTTDLTGFKVEALDGEIGSVDEENNDIGSSFLVIDTGPWIFGKKVLLPAGVIDRVDLEDRHLFVNRTKDEIHNAPEFDETRYTDPAYRTEIGSYYESRTPVGTSTRTQL
jgi:hypothetical protein